MLPLDELRPTATCITATDHCMNTDLCKELDTQRLGNDLEVVIVVAKLRLQLLQE